MNSMVKKALKISYFAHLNQVDKGGMPYFLHPFYVALNVYGAEAKIVALLHDVVEDTEITLDDLKDEGFSEEVLEAVDAIKKKMKAMMLILKGSKQIILQKP